MKYLSIDLEATGLDEHDLVIEFAAVPFNTQDKSIEYNLSFHRYIKCPSFKELSPNLNPWVREHNETLIKKAHLEGLELSTFTDHLSAYLTSSEIQNYFGKDEKIILFGKSMNAIDLPFLTRDLGWEFIRKYFSHRQLDLSCVAYAMVDMGKLPEKCRSGSGLMKHFKMGEVAHTALEDAVNTAKMYLELI